MKTMESFLNINLYKKTKTFLKTKIKHNLNIKHLYKNYIIGFLVLITPLIVFINNFPIYKTLLIITILK